ncbi:putative acyltransferase [Phycisphaera mikurensis NBRC 102666]|uniref:Putative acyltransferase n=1 Tax=Phycisphaera mikurensis (strain NBRC 102666 / KCTC 22515 / FYK2301M01) TaxID=1142394 RepID=I0IIR6_PHYMF|nr:putative acyltransferase [Phycisphaera mikurensis NBRC 102666]
MYRLSRLLVGTLFRRFVRLHWLHRERLDGDAAPPAGHLLAVTHLAHLEPVILGTAMRRRVWFVSRDEFYRRRWARWLLHRHLCVRVHRSAATHSTFRAADRLLAAGETVGIFPEGGCVRGEGSLLLGATPKAGVCVMARRAGVPVLPVAVLGCQGLQSPAAFLPWRRSPLYLAVGEPLLFDGAGDVPGEARRVGRERDAAELGSAFEKLYAEMLTAWEVPANARP